MAKYMRSYFQYVNEAEGEQKSLRGYKAETLIQRIEDLMEVLSDRVRFGVPSDYLGKALTSRDANGAIQRIKELQRYYSGNAEEVRFYCWSIAYTGSFEATESLKEKIAAAGGFGSDLNMNLKKVASYFSENKEDSDNVATISIGMDAQSIRDSINKAKQKKSTPKVEKEGTTPGQEPTEESPAKI
jgi:hypothetical protein